METVAVGHTSWKPPSGWTTFTRGQPLSWGISLLRNWHSLSCLSSLASKSSKPGCIYLWSWSRSFDTKGKGCQRTLSAVILAELEWSMTDLSYLTLSTCPGRQHPSSGWAARLCQSLQQRWPRRSRFALNSCACLPFHPSEEPVVQGRGLDFSPHQQASNTSPRLPAPQLQHWAATAQHQLYINK